MFKQVVTKVDQPGGKVVTSMYLRLCKHGLPDLGCTPYIIGPIPFLTYKEKQFIYLGAGNPKDDGSGIGFPGGDDPLSATDGFEDDCSTKLSGAAVDKAIGAVDKVAAALRAKDGAFATNSGNGAKHIPTILAALKEEGITDPNQVSYVLATVHRETSFVNFEEGATRYVSSGGTQYWGRGYVQLTHKANYQAATNYLKSKGMNVDLVANPELARRPDIAAKILARGMKTGKLFGDGMTLGKCAGGGRVDWVKCRRIVNGGAQAQDIAQAAKLYRDQIAETDLANTKSEGCNGAAGGKSIPCPPGKKCVLQNPLPGGGQTSPYGPRNGRLHAGIDLQTAKGYNAHPTGPGSQILAAADGRVKEYGPVGGKCGGVISIMHPQLNLETRYLHMVKLLVPRGATVKRGQPIGLEGNETAGSCSGGVHLHYEIYPNGGGAVNPDQFPHDPPLGRR